MDYEKEQKNHIFTNMLSTAFCKDDTVCAEVCRLDMNTGEKETYRAEVSYGNVPFALYNSKGELLESHQRLQEAIYSDFYEVYRTLKILLATFFQHTVYTGSILSRIIVKKKELDSRENIISAVNLFRYAGQEYAAAVIHDFTAELPEYTYAIFINNSPAEEYDLLEKAFVSEFYPVLAELENMIIDAEGQAGNFSEGREKK